MGLDMTYSLIFDTPEETKNFYNILEVSFIDKNDFYLNEDNVSIYYRLNWTGVRFEQNIFISKFIEEYSKNIDNEKRYIFINENGTFNFWNGEINKILYLEENISKKIKEFFHFPLNPIDLLSLGFWKGSNGEEFILEKRGNKIYFLSSDVEYDEEGDIVSESTDILMEMDKDEFMKHLSDSISFIKSILDKMDDNYINIKSREVLFFLKYFMYNDCKLVVFMG